MDVAMAFPGTWMGKNDKMSSEKVGVFEVKVRAREYNRESKQEEYVNKYFRLKAFGKMAESLSDSEAWPKGTVVFVRGELDELTAWTNKDGAAQPQLTVRLDSVRRVPKDFTQEDEVPTVEVDDEPPPPPGRTARVTF